jgi:outer membrane protein, heavy metal efflux system
MKLSLLLLCTFLFVFTARAEPPPKRVRPRDAESPSRLSVLSLGEVTRSALANNASIKAVRARWEMMKARIPQAAAWEDPSVGVDVERMGTTRLNTFTDAEWMVSQRIPISGKNRSRARAASAEAFGTLEELRRQQLDVVAKVRAAYFRLLNADAQLEVNRRNEVLLSQFVEISRAKYEVGAQGQASVLIAETDLIRQIENRKDLERDLSEAQSQLNVLMNRPARSPLGRAADFTAKHTGLESRRLEGLALDNRPELQLAEQKIAAEQQKLEVAKRDWIPEPELRVEARQYKGGTKAVQEYDTGIFFNVPLGNWGKYAAQEREARSSVEMATRELEMERTETLGLVRDAMKKAETFHHHVELFRDRLLPTARQTVEASQAGYESDKTGFLDVITAQRSLRDIESMYYRHLTDYYTALAELEAIIGADLRIFPAATFTTTTRTFK